MTQLDEPGGAESVAASVFEVFNPDYSVGVACDRSGWIVGVHLGDEVYENTDLWLSAEIIKVARLARIKSEVGRRAGMLSDGALPHTADRLGLPTETDFARQLDAAFGAGY